MAWGLRKIPVSRWYVISVPAGVALLTMGLVSCVPIGHGIWSEPYVVALRLVDAEGQPLAGVPVYATEMTEPSLERDYFGETGPDGYLFAVLPMMECRSVFLGGFSGRARPPRDVHFFVRDGEEWQSLGSTEAVHLPKSEARFWPMERMRDRSQRQIESFPGWASDVDILHATVDRNLLRPSPESLPAATPDLTSTP